MMPTWPLLEALNNLSQQSTESGVWAELINERKEVTELLDQSVLFLLQTECVTKHGEEHAVVSTTVFARDKQEPFRARVANRTHSLFNLLQG